MKKLIALIMLLSSIAYGSPQTWTYDASHAGINFEVDHLTISTVSGKFNSFNLDVTAEKEDFTDAKFKLAIDLKSINTNNEKRDAHLQSGDFFDAEKFPQIIIEGKKVQKLKNGKLKILADVTMHGITKEIPFEGTMSAQVKDPWGGTRIGFKISGKIDRYDFNLKYNSVLETGGLAIGQIVTVNANFELIKKVEEVKK